MYHNCSVNDGKLEPLLAVSLNAVGACCSAGLCPHPKDSLAKMALGTLRVHSPPADVS